MKTNTFQVLLKKQIEIDGSQRKFAKRTGIGQSTINDWLYKEEPEVQTRMLRRLAENTSVTYEDWLASFSQTYTQKISVSSLFPPLTSTDGPGAQTRPAIPVPVLNSGPCGEWRDLTDLDYPAGHADRYEMAPTKDKNAFYLVASGDSMIGGNIEEGDLLLVEPNTEWHDGNIVFARIDGGCTIKRIFRHEDKIELRPMNPNHKSLFVSDDESLRVMRVKSGTRDF